jgi:hypothetical protein
LAVLSAVAHAADETQVAARVAFAALTAVLGLDDERALLYSDWIRAALSDAARAALERMMNLRNYEYQSDFARKHDAQGQARGRVSSILGFLEARGLSISDEQRARIEACSDLDVLDGWVRRAATIATIDELFA